MTQVRVQDTITIANGATTSSVVKGEWDAAYMLFMPAAFTGTEISFTASPDGIVAYTAVWEYDEVTNDGTTMRQTKRTVAAGRAIDMPVSLTAAPFWKIVSNQNEGAARTFILSGKTN